MKRVLFTIGLVLTLTCNIMAADKPFKVGLLVPSTITDGGWSQLAYEGLQMIEKELGAEISYVEAGNPGDMIENASQYAEDGYQMVIGHGFQYAEPFSEISPNYPDTIFITSGGAVVTDNQSPLQFRLELITYMAGVLSSELTKTKKIGFVGGMDIPAVSKTFRGFELGAKSEDTAIEAITTYVGSWDDVNAGYEAGRALIEQGCDVLYANGNAVGLGVIKAGKEKGVWMIGMSYDQSELAPDHIIASMGNDTKVGLLTVAKAVKEGTYKPGLQEVGIADGSCTFLWNEKLKGKVSPEMVAKLEDIQKKLMAEEIKVPRENDM